MCSSDLLHEAIVGETLPYLADLFVQVCPLLQGLRKLHGTFLTVASIRRGLFRFSVCYM